MSINEGVKKIGERRRMKKWGVGTKGNVDR